MLQNERLKAFASVMKAFLKLYRERNSGDMVTHDVATDGTEHLTIFNSYRVNKYPSGHVWLEEYDLQSGKWIYSPFDTWKITPWNFADYTPEESDDDSRFDWRFVKHFFWALTHKYLYHIKNDLNIKMPNEAYNYFPHLFYEAKNGWHPSSNDYFRVKEEIIAKDIRKYQLNPEQRQKALSLFESKLQSFIPTNITHFLFNLDKRKTWHQWVSPMMCCACNLEGFKKIENEHPNLLPLLPQIETKFWGDDNLFSFESWRKILPNENISNLPSCNFDKFERRGNFEFFRKMDFKSIQTCIPLLDNVVTR